MSPTPLFYSFTSIFLVISFLCASHNVLRHFSRVLCLRLQSQVMLFTNTDTSKRKTRYLQACSCENVDGNDSNR
ncbi:hypothetical protein K469DRAFT_719951 [Zopfia rhizophila CBS 207.26]|uniref:Uncharacterized protein n=1 Tax=Zopfia rhizophila CBS 207.26 TaxID=1314779 RepID=A0A6A6EG05_9PEZI|nr:hypothetical protein K469DRAFT_719951 [Zopfia rhizophila CBS 207.26]